MTLAEIYDEGTRLALELLREDWALRPQADFDRLVGDVARWRIRVNAPMESESD